MIPSALYAGRVWHRRSEPAHAFTRSLWMAYVDVAAVDAAPGGRLDLVRGLPIRIRRQDHLQATDRKLSTRVGELVAPALGHPPSGPIALLTQPRMFGLSFNPVSFFYCLDRRGESIEAVLAEVSNTPWAERHAYVLTGGVLEADGGMTFRAEKKLHVSPFFGMDHEYHFRFSPPKDRLEARITNTRADRPVFEAGVALSRVSGWGRAALPSLLRHPWMPAETWLGIHAQAVRLAWKRAPFHPHPRRLHSGGSAPVNGRPPQ